MDIHETKTAFVLRLIENTVRYDAPQVDDMFRNSERCVIKKGGSKHAISFSEGENDWLCLYPYRVGVPYSFEHVDRIREREAWIKSREPPHSDMDQTDVLAYLETVMLDNTEHYQTDFEYDKKILREAVLQGADEERTFYWMSRPCGTWCLPEREVLLLDTEAHNIWTYHQGEADKIRAFRVHITSIGNDGKPLGDIHPIRYDEQVERIKRNALPVQRVTGTYVDGTTFSVAQGRPDPNVIREHGGIAKIRYEPENEQELSNLIAQEHREQDKRPQRNRQKRKSVER